MITGKTKDEKTYKKVDKQALLAGHRQTNPNGNINGC
jgi:hypothetical protein